MSDRMQIEAREHGLVRVFTLDIDPGEIDAWMPPEDADATWPLRDALGAQRLTPDKVEVFRADTLAGIGLTGYLVDGAGVDPSEIGQDAARLDALRGVLVVIPSSAFGDTAQTLSVTSPLRHVGTYREEAPEVAFHPLPAPGGDGLVTGMPDAAPDPGRSPRGSLIVLAAIALVALLALVFGVFAL